MVADDPDVPATTSRRYRGDEIDTPWGDAYRRDGDSITIARQTWGGDTWRVASSPDDLIHVHYILGNHIFGLAVVAALFPRDSVLAVARSLQPVSEDEWTASIADAQLD